MINGKIKTFRRGAYVRYIGSDPLRKELWGDSIQRVEHKCGNMVVGNFPAYICGQKHHMSYSVPICDLEIVIR